jgi:hypothetical protein
MASHKKKGGEFEEEEGEGEKALAKATESP